MSEEIRRRAKTSSSSQEDEDNKPKEGFERRELERGLVSSLLHGIVALVWGTLQYFTCHCRAECLRDKVFVQDSSGCDFALLLYMCDNNVFLIRSKAAYDLFTSLEESI